MRARNILVIVAFVITYSGAHAQVAGTQYFMNSLPQYVSNNPAFMPKYKFALGLPGSMIDVNYYNSGFTYNDFTAKVNGGRVATPSRLIAALPKKTYITMTTQMDLLRFGMKIGTNMYVSFNSAVRGYGRTMIPKDAVALIANGNAGYVGKTASISPTADMILFLENSVGFAISPNEKLSVGARAKFLRGFMNANTASANASISVANDYAVTMAADLNVRTSGIYDNGKSFNLSNYSGNNGVAFDLGATYKLIPKLTLAASLLDIGAIKWKYDTYQYTLDKSKATYTFDGIDMASVVNGNRDGQAISDSLKTKFKPQEKAGSSYSTALPAKTLLSANYDVTKSFSVGMMAYAERFMGRTATGATIGINKHFGKVLSTSVSYGASNRSFNNLGAGFSLNLAPVQFYIVGDNLLRMPMSAIVHKNINEFANRTQVFTLRAGLNFVWGWDKGPTKAEENPYKGKTKKAQSTTDKTKQPGSNSQSVNIRKKKR
jgi:hypothetical protein